MTAPPGCYYFARRPSSISTIFVYHPHSQNVWNPLFKAKKELVCKGSHPISTQLRKKTWCADSFTISLGFFLQIFHQTRPCWPKTEPKLSSWGSIRYSEALWYPSVILRRCGTVVTAISCCHSWRVLQSGHGSRKQGRPSWMWNSWNQKTLFCDDRNITSDLTFQSLVWGSSAEEKKASYTASRSFSELFALNSIYLFFDCKGVYLSVLSTTVYVCVQIVKINGTPKFRSFYAPTFSSCLPIWISIFKAKKDNKTWQQQLHFFYQFNNSETLRKWTICTVQTNSNFFAHPRMPV